jgi:hypothetical protein
MEVGVPGARPKLAGLARGSRRCVLFNPARGAQATASDHFKALPMCLPESLTCWPI